MVGVSGAPMSIKIGGRLAKMPHVSRGRAGHHAAHHRQGLEVLYGSTSRPSKRCATVSLLTGGGPFQGPNDYLVDDYFAQSQHVKVGDTIEILNHPFRVAGIVEHGRGARKFLPIEHAAGPDRSAGKASVFYVSWTTGERRRGGARGQEHAGAWRPSRSAPCANIFP